jgi:hypothetical protein
MSTHQIVASFGLALDIIGAIWVVKGMLWISDKELARASDRVGVWGGPDVDSAPQFPRPELLALLKGSRRDARIGAALLAVGFGCQFLALWV